MVGRSAGAPGPPGTPGIPGPPGTPGTPGGTSYRSSASGGLRIEDVQHYLQSESGSVKRFSILLRSVDKDHEGLTSVSVSSQVLGTVVLQAHPAPQDLRGPQGTLTE